MDIITQSYKDNWSLYERALSGPSSIPGWDICVLTAANECQARAYEMQLEERHRSNLLPARTQWMVIPDRSGVRIGSGGATLSVLLAVMKALEPSSDPGSDPEGAAVDILRGRRVLIVHSGGDSKRLPHYSAFGKLFARVPHILPDGRASTLFDEFIVSMSGLPLHMHEGVVVASGDVLLLFDHMQLDFNRQGVVGVGMSVPADVGTKHGVFVAGKTDGGVVRQFLHKPDLDRIKSNNALEEEGRVVVDTGIVWMDPDVIGKLVRIAGPDRSWFPHRDGLLNQLITESIPVNLYGDLMGVLPPETDNNSYINDESDGPATLSLKAVRERIWNTLRGHRFTVQSLRPARFIHFGTTQEYRRALTERRPEFVEAGWTSQIQSYLPPPVRETDSVFIASLIDSNRIQIGEGTIVEDSLLKGPIETGSGCVLAGLRHVKEEEIVLGDDLVLHQLPLRSEEATGWVSRLYGVFDNPKLEVDDGGATYLNQPFRDWMERAGISDRDLWGDLPPENKNLWNARLYPISYDPESSWQYIAWMLQPERATDEERSRWYFARRTSLEESYYWADLERLLENMRGIEDATVVAHFLEQIRLEKPSKEIPLDPGRDSSTIQRRIDTLVSSIREDDDALFRIRAFKGIADALASENDRSIRMQADLLEEEAFDSLSVLIRESTPPVILTSTRKISAALDSEQAVVVQAPARIDFGGGWSDTPPYSIECGGTVLNAAIALDGDLPIKVEAAYTDDTTFWLESGDLGINRRMRPEDLLDYQDLSDPLALHKAALILCGLHENVERGIRLRTEIAIPKGSGLGTSSIVSAALLTALNRLIGAEITSRLIFDQVLCLEQMLTTGGGWQDQVGGMVGGIKMITTNPGLPQVPEWEPVPIPEGFDKRLVLVYTGQRRLAKRILRTIMGRYISRDPLVVGILRHIQDLSHAMRKAIEVDDLDLLGILMTEHWEANKKMDPGSTNPFIDVLFDRMTPYITGGKLAGAGGGGFAITVSKDAGAASELARMLENVYPDSDVRVWPCRIVDSGLC